MKTENTLENKAKFFAQYWGQKVFKYTREGSLLTEEIGNVLFIPKSKAMNFSCLELKPLSQISDEDAIEVAKLVSPMLFEGRGKNGGHYIDKSEIGWYSVKHNGKTLMVDIDLDGYVFEYDEVEEYKRPSRSLIGTDYLRSKCYALPWMDLSVEDLVEYGWVKLKEN